MKDDLKKLEELMRPGQMSNGGFLGYEESLERVLYEDNQTVNGLLLTHERIADRIEYFIDKASSENDNHSSRVIDKKYKVSYRVTLGYQRCPWDDNDTPLGIMNGNMDFVIRNTELNEEIKFSGAIAHLIRNHRFYEGRESPYRVDPEKVARVLEVN